MLQFAFEKQLQVGDVVMKKLFVFIAMVLLGVGAAAAETGPSYKVNQITDPTSSTPAHMFRFDPDLLEVPVGARVVFANFEGDHTVISIKKMTPDNGPVFKFNKLDPNRSVVFDIPGVYGITCGLHGRYGMAMIVKVGDEAIDFDAVRATVPGGRKGKKLNEVLDRLEK